MLGGKMSVDGRDLTIAGGLMLAVGVALPLLPGVPGVPCPLRSLTGVPCPLCGMTTSVVETLRLDLAAALAATPAGVLAVIVAVVLLLLRPSQLAIPRAAILVALAAMWVFQLQRFDFI